ncbi:hypothetical protein LZ30DRAFT_588597, partial [Colletotrichum cereale]
SEDYYGSTPLSIAARHGHIKVLKSLLETGSVDINSRDVLGRTPLWWASRRGESENLQLLLEAGKQRGTVLLSESTPMDVEFRHRRRRGKFCNICTFQFPAHGHWECSVCEDEGFFICSDCFRRGGHCPVGSHELTPRKH